MGWRLDCQLNQDVVVVEIEAMSKVDTNYEWIPGEPLVDKKSTFQAHLCQLNSENSKFMTHCTNS